MTSPIYLDYNATAPLRPEAAMAVSAALAAGGNPSSVHQAGRRARASLESARDIIAHAVGADAPSLTFTSGATEAINMALASMVGAGARRLLVSAVEHDGVREAAAAHETAGVAVETIPVDARGVVDVAWLDARLNDWDAQDGPPAIAVMAANNETGVLQPVADIGARVRDAGGLFLVDGVQALGRVDVDLGVWCADYMALSGHKVGGPAGVGVLACSERAPVTRILHGGGQERGRRGGTHNVAGATGFAAAVRAAERDRGQGEALAALRDGLEKKLRAARADVVVFGADAPRLANTSCIGLAGFSGELQVMALDLDGVAVSAGAACSSGKVRPSHVLEAMGVGEALVGCAIRISLGWATTPEDVDACVDAWLRAADRAQPLAA